MKNETSISNFQHEIEKKAISWYEKNHGLEFDKNSPVLDGCSVVLDGYSKSKSVACEVYAHIGKLKPGQVHKIAQDALKLIYLDKKVKGGIKEKVLLFVDKDTCKPFTVPEKESKKWLADCLNKFNIKSLVYPLSGSDRKVLLQWQKRQGSKFVDRIY